jgi:hypothetical protein
MFLYNTALDKAKSLKQGDMVSWNSSGGTATGKVVRVMDNGTLDIPNVKFKIKGEKDNPAVLIQLYRDGKPTGTQVGHKMSSLSKSLRKAEACPTATGNIKVNLKNRKTAIDSAMYGPLNPSEPNKDYWKKLANEWDVTPADAKKQRCGNCAAFIQTPEMMKCISDGLTGGERKDEFDSIDEAGELGYCEIFDFKCAAARTCRAWITGGPVK